MRVARVLFFVLVGAFVVIALRDHWSQVAGQISRLSALSLAVGLAGAVASVACQLLTWRVLLADLGTRLPWRDAAAVFTVGQLGKYVPGSVWSLVGHMELGKAHQVPRARMAAASTLTLAIGLVTAVVIAAVTLPFVVAAEALGALRWLLPLLAPVAVAALHPRLLRGALNTALRLLKRPPLARVPGLRAMLVGSAWTVLAWVCYGVHAWLVALDLGAPATAASFVLAVGAFAGAWTAGFLFVIAPAGAGVRDGLLLLAFTQVLPVASATLLTLVSRLLVTVADLLAALVAVAAARLRRPPRPED